jgi:hypothetical protein
MNKADKRKKDYRDSQESAIKADYKSGIVNLRLLAVKYKLTINQILNNINK